MSTPDRTPVLVGVGEIAEPLANPADVREPVDLMAEALRRAQKDASGAVLGRLSRIDVVALISWRYEDPVSLLCERLGITPRERCNASFGGETPIRLLHEAAVRIARGELEAAAIVGAEALHARARARKQGVTLPWTAQPSRERSVVFPWARIQTDPIAHKLGVSDPAHIYPLYEMATQAAWEQSPEEGGAASAELWQRYAAVAAENPSAWTRGAPDAATIATVTTTTGWSLGPIPSSWWPTPT